jgi:hypothetical protein
MPCAVYSGGAAPGAARVSERVPMAYSLADDVKTAARWRLPTALAVAAGCYLMLLALGARLLGDADTFWQIAVGNWIMTQGHVPHVDVYSFTMAGKPWISSQWLAQVVFAELYSLAGWSGVVVASAAAIAGAFGLLTRFLTEKLAPTPALVMVAGAFVLASPHLVARPHVLALPVMVAWVAGLVRALDARRAPSFTLLPLMTLWANLHGGFTLGLALLAPLALDALWNAPAAERRRVAQRWGLFGLTALVAACVTPYGPESVLVTRRILGLGSALSLIGEWQPQDFATLAGFELCLLLGIGFALYRGLRLPPIRLLMLLGLVHMALAHSRNGEVLGLLAPLLIAAPLAPQLGRAEPAERGQMLPMLALSLALIAASVALPSALAYAPRAAITPARALAAIKAAGKTRILNSYDFGGYLIFHHVAPFIDGRTELYGRDFMLRHHRAVTLKDVGGFLKLLNDYRIDATLLTPATPANGLLDRLKGWKRIYADGVAVVHVRDCATDNMGVEQ